MKDQAPPLTNDVTAAFRRAMRCYAASVTIVTAIDEHGSPHGMTASAVTSVSLEPPSMLVAVNRSASLHGILAQAAHFCINVLGSDQLDIVERFSRSDLRAERFTQDRWVPGIGGLPHLADARSAIFCRMDRIIDYATHSLHLGVVVDVVDGNARLPLVWLNGARAEIAFAAC